MRSVGKLINISKILSPAPVDCCHISKLKIEQKLKVSQKGRTQLGTLKNADKRTTFLSDII